MNTIFMALIISLIMALPVTSLATGLPQFSAHFPPTFQKYLSSALEELFAVKGNQATPLHLKIFGGPVIGEIYRQC